MYLTSQVNEKYLTIVTTHFLCRLSTWTNDKYRSKIS